MRAVRLWAAALCLCAPSALGAAATLSATPLAGYAATVSGNTIVYQSYSPLASTALITRTGNGHDAIVWQTVPVPVSEHGPITFTWIAGYGFATSSGTLHFTLSIGETPALTFLTGKGTKPDWSVTGANGVTLSYRNRWNDVNGDRMGDMFLTVPSALYHPGAPLRLSVVGEAAGTDDWYMTFEHTQGEWADAVAQPALVRCGTRLCQIVDLRVSHLGAPAELRATSPTRIAFAAQVGTGYHLFELQVPAVARPADVPLDVTIGPAFRRRIALHLEPVARRTLYLIHHSHMDVGYNMTQPDAIQQQMKNVRDAMALIRKTASYPPAARFKWNIESIWGVEAFMRSATPAQRAEFVRDVRAGSIGIYANYANELTGIESSEELAHLTDYARWFERTYHVRIDAAFISDVPNYSWPIVPALASAGVRYFSAGPNYVFDDPEHGARVGYTYAHGDKPFWWISPSGTQRIFFWMAGHGYSSFHNYNMRGVFAPPTDRMAKLRGNLLQYVQQLQNERYPYEMVQVRYTYPADNSPVDPHLSDFVRAWNARYVSPKLEISTVYQLFDAFLRRYGKTLPSYAGDLTPYWDDGAISTAREQAMARRAQARVAQASILTMMLAPACYDAAAFEDAWRNLLMWSEHTWGAWNSGSDPDSPFVLAQWKFEQRFALLARQESHALVRRALGDRVALWATQFTVYNTASWPRNGVVVLDPLEGTGGQTVVDARGRAVPSQRLRDGRLAFLARDVPALGSARYTVTHAPWRPQGDAHASGTTLRTHDLVVTLDPKTGAIASLRLRGHEFVDASKLPGANAYLYVPGLDPATAQGITGPVHITVEEPGPLVAELRVTSDAPGTHGLVRTVQVVSGSDRVDVADTIDKTRVLAKESVHIAFPFAVANETTRIDLGIGVLIPGVNQLPGANHDFYPVRRFVDVSNASDGVTWAAPDAPLVELGAITDERTNANGDRSWKRSGGSSALVYSYAMDNYWSTNFKASQSGPVTLRYALLPHASPYDGARAARFGASVEQPLIVAPSRPGDDPAAPLTVSGDAVVIALYPAPEPGRYLVRLYNPDAHAITTVLRSRDASVRLTLPRYDERVVTIR